MIIITGMYNVKSASVHNVRGLEAGAPNVQMAVDSILVGFGSKFLAIALFFFCFTTMITYYYKAETSLSYMIKNRLDKRICFCFPYALVF